MTDPLDPLPAPLRAAVATHWAAYLEAAARNGLPPLADPALLTSVPAVWAASDFVAHACRREPQLLAELWASGDLQAPYPPGDYAPRLARALAGVTTEPELAAALRRFRRREMVRIAWRDIAGWAPLDEVLRETSELAEGCVDGALGLLHGWFCRDFGTPRNGKGEEQRLVVVGMGKLGAWELNFSSDIDLIYAYPDEGETDGPRPRANEEFFTRLGRALTSALSAITADGYVFRVDLRLRPFGESGPPVMSFAAMELYYQSQGRSWERYAMIKARVVAGDRRTGQHLLQTLRPFVYRRYLDFGAFESLREMKGMIAREVGRKGMAENIKLGPGGIREVEFIGQAFQLVFGGRQPRLRERAILKVLGLLVEEGHLPAYAAHRLGEAYKYLRRVENRLQQWADEQTQALPEEETARLRLACAMGQPDWASFLAELERHRRVVQAQFEQTFAAPQAEGEGHADGERLAALWQGGVEEATALATLAECGFGDPAETLRQIDTLRGGRANRAVGEQGRRWLDRLMPLLLAAAAATATPEVTLQRVLALVEAVARRTAYLVLLVESPMALSQLVKLCAASPWIAAYLARQPILLDELLDPRSLYAPLRRDELAAELTAHLDPVDPDDLEGQMVALRHFKNANVLRVAAADLSGGLKLARVSDYLTEIAELVLAGTLRLARDYFVARYGVPHCTVAAATREAGFAIVGYGKLGGIELGYGSDLDIVFLHDSSGENQFTDGERAVDNAVFFGRLGQRIIHLLETMTAAGVLYEVDARLRPNGASGALASGLEAFERYQHHDAWTWEHQALVRARVVAGSGAVAERFRAIRRAVLGRRRDLDRLRREVVEMREKMRTSLDKGGSDGFDLKHGRGGIVDIEFIAQYGVLAWGCDHPPLLEPTDDHHILDALADAGRITPQESRLLVAAHRAYRAEVHRCKLLESPAILPADAFAEYRGEVMRIWGVLLEA